jgi:hypothetical protein
MVVIIALAGRRIDAPDAPVKRFPRENVAAVREQLRALFVETHATWLVSSAACGADLIAQDLAGELGLRRRIILPFASKRFRAMSVVDRPGDWGHLFDSIRSEVSMQGNLKIFPTKHNMGKDILRANRAILDNARKLSTSEEPAESVTAVLVWDGRSRGADDYTDAFARAARALAMPVREVRTL